MTAVTVICRGVTVGHVPRYVSWGFSLFLQLGDNITATVVSTRRYSRDLPPNDCGVYVHNGDNYMWLFSSYKHERREQTWVKEQTLSDLMNSIIFIELSYSKINIYGNFLQCKLDKKAVVGVWLVNVLLKSCPTSLCYWVVNINFGVSPTHLLFTNSLQS